MTNFGSLSNLLVETKKLIATQLWVKMLVCLLMGLIVGLLIGPDFNYLPRRLTELLVPWVALPGQIFLILMRMIVLPLVVASVILGIIQAKSLKTLKFIASRLFPYFVFTTIVATMIGFSVALFIQPGKGIDTAQFEVSSESHLPASLGEKKSIPETLTSILPSNPLGSMMEGELFQVVLFALLIGVALLNLKTEDSAPIVTLLQSIQKLTLVVVGWAMKLAPLAVFGLMLELFSKVGIEMIWSIGLYALSVLITLVGIILFYLLILKTFTSHSLSAFMQSARSLQLLAFSTSSSAAVMPLSIQCAEEKLGVSPSVARFVIPLGTTINMDGTAAYQAVASCFIAQAFGLDLSISQLLLIVISATGASIGAPGTPGVGIAVLATILTSVGIPPQGVILILGIDRLLDMARTVVNVTGDLTASVLFQRFQIVDEK